MQLNQILERTVAISREAGAFIQQERKSFDIGKVERKGVNDLVSYVDREVEQFVVDRLHELLPEAGFITEEGTSEAKGEIYDWIIDPLDGTTNFIHGLPVYSVSIGLKKQEEIVLGVVFEVNQNECFSAIKGGGAFCNGIPIEVSETRELSSGLIATGFPHNGQDQISGYLGVLKSLIENSRGFRRLGSAAVDLCYVAAGRVDGYFQHKLHPYDVAGGSIIVEEAGGKVTDFSGAGNYLFGGEIVASNGALHQELLGQAKLINTKQTP